MKKVINRKVYNTKTATKIAYWDNGLGANDFNSCDESLYKTPKGAYFVHRSGGGLSPWSARHGDGYGYGSDFCILSESEALEWCERHDVDADDIALEFEHLIEDA